MGKCKTCKCGDMIPGYDNIKSDGKKYEMYVCTNCDSIDYQEVKGSSKKQIKI